MRTHVFIAICVAVGLALSGCGSDYEYDDSFEWGKGASSIEPTGVIGSGHQNWSQDNILASGSDLQSFWNPSSVFIDKTSNYIYVADTTNNRIVRRDMDGQAQGWIGNATSVWNYSDSAGMNDWNWQAFSGPMGVVVYGGYIYVADTGNNRISRWGTDGVPAGWIGMGYTGWQTIDGNAGGQSYNEFQNPMGVCVGPDGDGTMSLFVADTSNSRVCKWTMGGSAIGWIGDGAVTWQTGSASGFGGSEWTYFNSPRGVAVDPCGNVYVADTVNNRICKWDAWGWTQGWIGEGDGWWGHNAPGWGSDWNRFNGPTGVCLDHEANIYVADRQNNRVCKWNRYGQAQGWFAEWAGWRTDSGTGTFDDWRGFNEPNGVFWDIFTGEVYIADSRNHRISRWEDANYPVFLSPDVTPPTGINNLSLNPGTNSGEFELTWTAPGDDADQGQAFMYVIRSSTMAIVIDLDFHMATHIPTGMWPRSPGDWENLGLGGYTLDTTYWFAIKTRDEAGNWSPLSNVVSGMPMGSGGG